MDKVGLRVAPMCTTVADCRTKAIISLVGLTPRLRSRSDILGLPGSHAACCKVHHKKKN